MPLRLHLLPKSPSFTGVRPLKMEFLGFNLDESVLILINIHSVPCVEEAFHKLGCLKPLFIARKPKEVFRKTIHQVFLILSSFQSSEILQLALEKAGEAGEHQAEGHSNNPFICSKTAKL